MKQPGKYRCKNDISTLNVRIAIIISPHLFQRQQHRSQEILNKISSQEIFYILHACVKTFLSSYILECHILYSLFTKAFCKSRLSKFCPLQLFITMCQGCIFFYNPPPPWGGGKESKGLRAREENQRVEKMERQREKKRKISVGNS